MSEPDQVVRFVVYGQPVSKANRRMWVRGRSIKSEEALRWVAAVRRQLYPVQADMRRRGIAPFVGPVGVQADVYYRSWRPDLDLSLLYDVLQGIVYKNDRQVVEQLTRRYVDRAVPRVEVSVYPVERPDYPVRQAGPKSSPVACP